MSKDNDFVRPMGAGMPEPTEITIEEARENVRSSQDLYFLEPDEQDVMDPAEPKDLAWLTMIVVLAFVLLSLCIGFTCAATS